MMNTEPLLREYYSPATCSSSRRVCIRNTCRLPGAAWGYWQALLLGTDDLLGLAGHSVWLLKYYNEKKIGFV